MLVKQTAWLFVKALFIGGAVSLFLAQMENKPFGRARIAEHLSAMTFW